MQFTSVSVMRRQRGSMRLLSLGGLCLFLLSWFSAPLHWDCGVTEPTLSSHHAEALDATHMASASHVPTDASRDPQNHERADDPCVCPVSCSSCVSHSAERNAGVAHEAPTPAWVSAGLDRALGPNIPAEKFLLPFANPPPFST